ncbi:MAG: hypothetical protein M1830_005633 [Pleopsidium flavum]|nr:MAG: hypothetical protein M1830_005633 [Pleopsidium flavum]
MVRKAKLKRKNLRSLFDPDTSLPSSHRSNHELKHGATDQESEHVQDLEHIRDWFAHHQEVQPLVDLRYKRTRFVGLGNNTVRGFWATLDKEVIMTRTSVAQLGSFQGLPTPDGGDGEVRDAVLFSHAVLEVRWEGDSGADLVRALDQSHLTEQVREFSLETHAVFVLYKPKHMSPPSWIPALDGDIRKVPAAAASPRRRSTTYYSSPGSASTKPKSTSATSTADGPSSSGVSGPDIDTPSTSVPDMLESHPVQAFRKKRRTLKQHPLRKQIDQSTESKYQRYWNEFDDADETSDNEAYTILVDPNAPSNLPGATWISSLANVIISNVKLTTEKFTHGLSPRYKAYNYGRCRGKDDQTARQPEAEDSDEDDSSGEHPYHHRHYSTFPEFDYPVRDAFRNRETLLFRLYVTGFAVSFILLFIGAILEASARPTEALPADLGLLVGVIAALASSVAAIGLMYARKDPLSWLHKLTALVAFALVWFGSAILLAVVGSG